MGKKFHISVNRDRAPYGLEFEEIVAGATKSVDWYLVRRCGEIAGTVRYVRSSQRLMAWNNKHVEVLNVLVPASEWDTEDDQCIQDMYWYDWMRLAERTISTSV